MGQFHQRVMFSSQKLNEACSTFSATNMKEMLISKKKYVIAKNIHVPLQFHVR
jgi:hypothetical protein